jgi:hypothetical protein
MDLLSKRIWVNTPPLGAGQFIHHTKIKYAIISCGTEGAFETPLHLEHLKNFFLTGVLYMKKYTLIPCIHKGAIVLKYVD